MTDDASFIQAIVDSPFDEGLRLVYADWLEERSDPRAEYLRIEAAFRTLPRDSPEVIAGYKRWPDLSKLLDPEWLILMDRRVATPPGIGVEGRQAVEIIRRVFIEERQINTCDCQAFYSPQEWRNLRHRVPAELEMGLRPVLVVVYSGGFVGDCFDGFDSDKFDEYLKLPENQRVRVYPLTLAMRRKLTDKFRKADLVARVWCPSYSFVCTKPVAANRQGPKGPKRMRRPA